MANEWAELVCKQPEVFWKRFCKHLSGSSSSSDAGPSLPDLNRSTMQDAARMGLCDNLHVSEAKRTSPRCCANCATTRPRGSTAYGREFRQGV